ncbi:MAG TPA: hypothetical protein VMZ03_03795 [Chitinophagaceae bacterium]|nr:hypothetical protein [Chitinophagaceae bacterium]
MIVNKTHPEIIASRRAKGITYLTLMEKYIYFPKQVCHFLGISKEKFIHFDNDGASWSMFINNDPDGFTVTYDKGFKIASRALAAMIQRSTGREFGSRFYVKKTSSKKGEAIVYEIMTKAEVIIPKNKKKVKTSQ